MPITGTILPIGGMPSPRPITTTPSPRPLRSAETEAPKPRQVEMRKLREAVADFEALLLSHMLKSMQGTVAKADLGVDSGGDVLKEVGWEKVGQSLAHKGGLGLGDMLFKALSKRVLATSSEAEVKPSTLEDLVGSARLGRHMMPLGTPDKE